MSVKEHLLRLILTLLFCATASPSQGMCGCPAELPLLPLRLRGGKQGFTTGEDAVLQALQNMPLEEAHKSIESIVKEKPSLARKYKESGELNFIDWSRWGDELDNENVEIQHVKPDLSASLSDEILKYEEIEDYMRQVRESRVDINEDWDNEEKFLNFTRSLDDRARRPRGTQEGLTLLPEGWTVKDVDGRPQYCNEQLGIAQSDPPLIPLEDDSPPPAGTGSRNKYREQDKYKKPVGKSKTADRAKEERGGEGRRRGEQKQGGEQKKEESNKERGTVGQSGQLKEQVEGVKKSGEEKKGKEAETGKGEVQRGRERRAEQIEDERMTDAEKGAQEHREEGKQAQQPDKQQQQQQQQQQQGKQGKQQEGKQQQKKQKTAEEETTRGGEEQGKKRTPGDLDLDLDMDMDPNDPSWRERLNEYFKKEWEEEMKSNLNKTNARDVSSDGALQGFHPKSGMRMKDHMLWEACEDGRTDIVERMLRKGADPNVKHHGVFKWTPMHLAAINDQAPTLDLLHEYGGELNTRDAGGRTPIRLARKHCRLIAVRALEKMMGYDIGDGSVTDADYPEDWGKLLNLSDVDSLEEKIPLYPYKNVSKTQSEDKFLNGTWRWNGWTEEQREDFKKRYEDSLIETEERKERKRASERRRKAFCEFADEEPVGKDGMTESQRKHIEKLSLAANMNQACGIPMERVINPQARYQPPPEKERSKLNGMEEGPIEDDSQMPSEELEQAIEEEDRELMKD